MESLVFFGKGGIGKSTVCANLSALFALSGRRVLHVGCDPKHDSTVAIAEHGTNYVKTFMEKVADNDTMAAPSDIALKGRFGIDIIEAGGPQAGVGCAGRGISLMLETFKETELLKDGNYDVAMYDILGDVVCGGFATPLRAGFGRKIFIVCSEELMSIYAANNIAKAVRHYSANGIRLGGIIANIRDPQADLGPLCRFAARINTQVLQFIPRDPAVREAEFERKTVVEYAPQSKATEALARLALKILALDPDERPMPDALDDEEFYAMSRCKFRTDANKDMNIPMWNNGLVYDENNLPVRAKDALAESPKAFISPVRKNESALAAVMARAKVQVEAESAPATADEESSKKTFLAAMSEAKDQASEHIKEAA